MSCRDLVLESIPDDNGTSPTKMSLRHMTELTRLVLKRHGDHFFCNPYDEAGRACRKQRRRVKLGTS